MSQRGKEGVTLSYAKREYIKFLIKLTYRETKEPQNAKDWHYDPLPYDKLSFSSVRWALEHHKEVNFTKDDVYVIFEMYDFYRTPPTLDQLKDEALIYIHKKLNKIEDKIKWKKQ